MIDEGHVNQKSIPEIQDYCFQVLKVYDQFNGCFYANQYGMWGLKFRLRVCTTWRSGRGKIWVNVSPT